MTKSVLNRRTWLLPLGLLLLVPSCEEPISDEGPAATTPRAKGGKDVGDPPHGTALSAPGNVGVFLADPVTNKPDSREELSALVLNDGKEAAQVEVFGVATGLNGKDGRRSLGVFEIEPGHEIEVTMPLEGVPVQTIGHAGLFRFEAVVDRGDGDLVPSRSERVYLDYSEDFAESWVYDTSGAAGRNAYFDKVAQQGLKQLGRYVDDEGQWASVSIDETLQRAGKWGPIEEIPKELSPDPEPPAGVTSKICGFWMSAYVDDQVGEDVLTAPGFELSKARYASASIRSANGSTTYWSGHLDENGCAPTLELQAGNYKLDLRSSFEGPQGQLVDVLYNYLIVDGPQGEFVSDFQLGFTIDPAWGPTSSQWLYTTNTAVTNIAAIISAVLGQPDNGLPAAQYTIHSNVDCPGLPGNACAPGTKMYVGTGPYGTSDDEWKYVIAHELGHNAQSASFGFPGGGGYDSVMDTEAACRCDHVTVANQLHCLQSLEHVGKAQIEGFAQYFAAKSFNTSGSDCGFAYYKEFLTPTTISNVITQPPIAIDCAAPQRWRSTHCSDIEDTGTELDWLTAFRALQRGGVTSDELYAVYAEACGGGSCSGQIVRWGDLAEAAETVFGSPNHIKAHLFDEVGVDHDVD